IVIVVADIVGIHVAAPGRADRRLAAARHAVATELDHAGPERAQLVQQIVRLRGPPGHELEAVAKPRALELVLDRARLRTERKLSRPARTSRQKQDELRHRRRLSARTTRLPQLTLRGRVLRRKTS